MRASLYHAVDDSLRNRIQGVAQFMKLRISTLSIDEMRDEFREHSVLGPSGDLFQVCDERGNWLYRSVPLENSRVAIRLPSRLGSAPLYENVEVEKTPIRLASQRVRVNGKPYTIQVAASMHELLESLDFFQLALLISIPLLLVAVTGGGYWISRRALAPVDEITRTARSISIQNLSERLSVPPTGDELQRLSETLNQMLARLNDSVRRMAQFTADASHELRAPIALIRTTAELSLRRDRDKEDYRDALRQVLSESERTTQLLDSLLFLARADSGAGNLDFVPLNLAESLKEALDRVENARPKNGSAWTRKFSRRLSRYRGIRQPSGGSFRF